MRHDPVTGRVVIVAAGRADTPAHARAGGSRRRPRPGGVPVLPRPRVDDAARDPAHRTPASPDEPGWRVRVFPNLYPITEAHEVVVLSPDHYRTFADLSDDAAAEVLTVLRDRVRAHLDAGLPFATAIVNQGRAAGASIAHPHAQVFGARFRPARRRRRDRPAAGRRPTTCSTTTSPTRRDRDLVVRDGAVAVWCPFASTSPLLLRVVQHRRRYARSTARPTARSPPPPSPTRDALAAIGRAVEHAPYNLVVHTTPRVGTSRSRPGSACSRDSSRRPASS